MDAERRGGEASGGVPVFPDPGSRGRADPRAIARDRASRRTHRPWARSPRTSSPRPISSGPSPGARGGYRGGRSPSERSAERAGTRPARSDIVRSDDRRHLTFCVSRRGRTQLPDEPARRGQSGPGADFTALRAGAAGKVHVRLLESARFSFSFAPLALPHHFFLARCPPRSRPSRARWTTGSRTTSRRSSARTSCTAITTASCVRSRISTSSWMRCTTRWTTSSPG